MSLVQSYIECALFAEKKKSQKKLSEKSRKWKFSETLKKSLFLAQKMMESREIWQAGSQRHFAEDWSKKRGVRDFVKELEAIY